MNHMNKLRMPTSQMCRLQHNIKHNTIPTFIYHHKADNGYSAQINTPSRVLCVVYWVHHASSSHNLVPRLFLFLPLLFFNFLFLILFFWGGLGFKGLHCDYRVCWSKTKTMHEDMKSNTDITRRVTFRARTEHRMYGTINKSSTITMVQTCNPITILLLLAFRPRFAE